MPVRWITEQLGTASAADVVGLEGLEVVDVRDLVDRTGNRTDAVKEKIDVGVRHLRSGAKIVVCCDYGMSRSNAIAAGIIAVHQEISFLDAVRMVQERTSETEIKLGPLEAVRHSIEGSLPGHQVRDARTILVTGARGFIGTAVCKRLENQFEIIAPPREQLDVELGSTQLSLLSARHDVDCIIHLANPRVYTSNVALGRTLTMLRNVLEVCESADISLIYLSGWEVYSGYAGRLLANESLPAYPRGPYGETKYLAELMIQQFQRMFDLRCSLIRSSPVYGAGSDRPKFLYNFIDKACRSEPIVTHRYLNGDPALDMLHIDDLVDAIVRTCVQQHVGEFNVGTGVAVSTIAIAKMLKDELNSRSRIEQRQIEAYTASIAMDYQKASNVLGWQPRVSLADGLQLLLRDRVEK